MRDLEKQCLALECLKMAVRLDVAAEDIVEAARKFYHFVTEADECDAKEGPGVAS